MKFIKELLVRKDSVIQNLLSDTTNGIDTSATLHMLFPSRFLTKGMAIMGSKMEVAGATLIMNDKHEFTVITLPNLISFNPSTVESITIDNKDYTMMEFTAPNFIDSIDVIDSADILVDMIDDFLMKSQAPFYMNTSDIFKLLSKGAKTTSTKITKNIIVPELLTSLVMKSDNGAARSTLSRADQDNTNKVSVVGLSTISGLENNTAKLVGSYLSEGIDSILADSTTQEETELEKILKL